MIEKVYDDVKFGHCIFRIAFLEWYNAESALVVKSSNFLILSPFVGYESFAVRLPSVDGVGRCRLVFFWGVI